MSKIRVVVRVRPPLPSEKGHATGALVADAAAKTVRVASDSSKSFAFDQVFAASASQYEIFQGGGISSMLLSVLDGFHATIFAYGQTGSGKTFTMEGYEYEKNPMRYSPDRVQAKPNIDVCSTRLGIVPRVILGLFDAIAAATLDKKREYSVKCSFVQIYNEQILDLLNFSTSQRTKPLRLRWASTQEFYVENLVVAACSSADEMLGRFQDGVKQKIMATHNLNAASSRSHCIYTLYVESVDPTNPDDVTKAKLSLVDLAGSERVVKTGATGVTLQESIGINKSLFVLRQVIQTLSSSDDGSATNKGVHVPYRDSKLTALLKHSLGGNSITLMIACLSPSDAYVDENLSTLVYAAKAQSISNKPVKNEDPKAQLIQKLRDEVATLKAQLAQAQQVILHLGQLGDQNDNVEATGAISLLADVTPSADEVPPVMKPVMAHTRPASSLASPSPSNNPATPSVQASPPAAVTSVVVSSAGTKRLKQNVIDNVELIKTMYQNERQLRSEVDFVTSEVSTVRMENRTLNLENQSLRERIEVLEYLVVGGAKGPEDNGDVEGVVELVAPPQHRIDQVLRSCVKSSRSQGALRPATTHDAEAPRNNAPDMKKRETGMLSVRKRLLSTSPDLNP
ncbi:hypothetical protein, variant [Aphanomyces astaci]|uniref:Kinesin-like protein n=1 Tax=Aphanomyces astaci TaxID=112090 RepID=W4H825_APHAT|nr:hypothetical protein, variant [Aphanomyces astaci]ETV88170.1 hypothetical protein, variant [Aphanomyces astaci]|eukprot:XP_009823033.1 hypothetical protein, variant [Aphanomyces astaci]